MRLIINYIRKLIINSSLSIFNLAETLSYVIVFLFLFDNQLFNNIFYADSI